MQYVILGSSAAGVNAARELRSLAPSAQISMISQDEVIYSRCILHHYLGEIRSVPQLNFAEKDFFSKFDIRFYGGKTVTAIDTDKKIVFTDKGTTVPYDKLLIATGSRSIMPPIPNLDQTEDKIGFRNLSDIDRIKQATKTKKNIVVLGAGLVGMDCVAGLSHLGLKPTVLDFAPHLLMKQLDDRAAQTYATAIEQAGVTQHYGVGVASCQVENGNLQALTLATGETIPCDFLIVTIGVRPDLSYLAGSGIATDKFGLTYDEKGQTNLPDVYGAGDVSGKAPIWPVAVKEGILAAHNMFGNERKMSNFFASKSTMNFFHIPTMSLGDVNLTGEGYEVALLEEGANYKKIIHKDGRIVGALLQGDLSYSGVLQQLIAHKIDVRHVKKSVFAIDYSDFFKMDDNFEFYYD